MMNDRVKTLLEQLQAEVDLHYPDWKIGEPEVAGSGLECLVCYANSAVHGPVALRIPWERWSSNDNDASVDGRKLLQQEATLAAHLFGHGLPVPQVYAFHTGESLDFLASAFIANDGSAFASKDLGRIVAAIHAAPLPDFLPLAQDGAPLHEVLAERLARRAKVVENLTGVTLRLPDYGGLASRLELPGARRSLLHMDIRPANVLSYQGAIAAVVDWSNALVGDPALELARIAEYGCLGTDFLAGYGNPDCFSHLPPGVETLYRLDTAIMLAVVFLSEAPNPDLAWQKVNRVLELQETLISEW